MTSELPTDIIEQLYGFVQGGRSCFFISPSATGQPIVRQVSAFVETGFVVGTISDSESLKAKHVVARGPVTYLWVQNREKMSSRQVTLQGQGELITDLDVVDAFMERRATFNNVAFKPVDRENPRYLIKVTPRLLRFEGFVPDVPNAVGVVRSFDPPVAERVQG